MNPTTEAFLNRNPIQRLEGDKWVDFNEFPEDQFRIKKPHQECRDAYAAGKKVQVWLELTGQWLDCTREPFWGRYCQYRVKSRWQAEIDALDAGKKVQVRWLGTSFPEPWAPICEGSKAALRKAMVEEDPAYEFRISCTQFSRRYTTKDSEGRTHICLALSKDAPSGPFRWLDDDWLETEL